MREPIFQPGVKFYVLRLVGTLTYTLTIPGKSPKTWDFHQDQFDDAEGVIKDEEPVILKGTDVSAVGLQLELIQNTGHLEMNYVGANGGSVKWTFDGLKEVGTGRPMCAWASTQANITTFVFKSTQKAQKPLIDAKSEAFVRSKDAEIISLSCRARNGDIWNVSRGGVAKRTREETEKAEDEDEEESKPIPRGRRSTTRKQARTDSLPIQADDMPRFLELPGGSPTGDLRRGYWSTGTVRLDRQDGSVSISSMRGTYDKSPIMRWELHDNGHQLQILHGDRTTFRSYHDVNAVAYGRDDTASPERREIHVNDFIKELREFVALAPQLQNEIAHGTEDVRARKEYERQKRYYDDLKRHNAGSLSFRQDVEWLKIKIAERTRGGHVD